MSRLRILLLALSVCTMYAAEPVTDLAGTVRAAREVAEFQLAASRTRIDGEQVDLLKRLQNAVAAQGATRDRLSAANREAKTATEELTKRLKEQDKELTLVKQLVDRAVIAARLGDARIKALAGKPPLERVEAAVIGVTSRIAALPARLSLHVADESIIGRDGAVAIIPVLRLGEARAIAVGSDANHRGLLEHAADGSSWLVVGPDLPPAVVPVNHVATLIPLDATGSAAHQPGAVHRTFAQWLAAGRAFIWPILIAFIIGFMIIIERIVALARRGVDSRRLVHVAGLLADHDVEGARRLVQSSSSPLDRVLDAGLKALGKPRETREAAVEQALLAETAQLTRGLPAIAVLAGVAPLLGLLGTVTGMIDMFSVIAAAGAGNAKSLSGGISEALICTQAGMLVAIPLLLAHAWLGRLADQRSHLLEEAACGVLGLAEHGDPPAGRATYAAREATVVPV